MLKANGCDGSLGLDTMSKYDWAEIKIGEASVVVRSNSNELDGFIGVSFAFSDDPEFRVHGSVEGTISIPANQRGLSKE